MGQADRNLERRAAPRFGVECWAEECFDAGVYFHRVTNLSRSGFFVAKKLPFRVGQTIRVRLDLPGFADKPETRSRVINNYRDPQDHLRGAGFQFLDLDAQSRKIIEAFIQKVTLQEK
jgi:Tfp pilus assembly protein PilZ